MTPFHTHGYQVIPGVVDHEVVRSLLTYLSADADDALTLLMADLRCPDLAGLKRRMDEMVDGPELGKLTRDQRMIISGHFPLETRLSRTLWQVPRLAAVRRVLETALGATQLYMHMPPTARFVLPGNRHAAVPAHQDVSYNRHMNDFVTLWVPLTPIDQQCGGVAVYPGTGSPIERQSPSEAPDAQKLWLNGVTTDGMPRVHCTMGIGDALLLNPWIVHESMPNLSSRVRYSVDFRFFARRENSSKHLLDMQTWQVVEPATQTAAA